MQDEFGRGSGTRFKKHFCRGGKWSIRCGWTFCETARTLYTVWVLGSMRNLPKQSKSFRETRRRGLLESELINTLAFFKHTVSGVCGVCLTLLWPHGLQRIRLSCFSLSPKVHSNSCPSSWWCHPATSSSVVPFSSRPQSLPASGSFPMSQLFAWGRQSTGVSASTSILPMNTQDWYTLGCTDWISLQSKELSRVFSDTTVQKHQFFCAQHSSHPTLTSRHDHWKNHSLD